MNKFATIFFKHTNNGWRISYIGKDLSGHVIKSVVDGLAWKCLFDDTELGVTCDVPAGLRVGQFCKRPHKLVTIKEVRK